MNHLNYHHLMHFYHVAFFKSFTKAANELKISQPTLSEQVKALEKNIGKPLFNKVGRELQLTTIGNHVFSFASNIFNTGHDLINSINSGEFNRIKKLRIGIMSSIPKLIVSHVLEFILEIDTQIEVEFHEFEMSMLKVLLSTNKIDLMVSDDPALGVNQDKYLNYDIGVSPAAIFKSKKNKRRYKNLPNDLNGERFVLPIQGSQFRSQVDLWFYQNKITPKIVAEAADTGLLKVFGEEGVGLFFSPIYLSKEIEEKFECKKLYEIRNLKQQFYLVTNESHLEKKIIKTLIDNIKAKTIFIK